MMPKFVFLATDWVLLCLLGFLVFYLWHVFRTEELRARWRFVVTNGLAVTALVFLSTFFTRVRCGLHSLSPFGRNS